MDKSLVMVIGLPGTGKSTVSGRLEERLRDYDLHGTFDVIRYFGHKRYRPKWDNRLFEEMRSRVLASFGADKSVIVHDSFFSYGRRQPFYNIALIHDASVLVIECICSKSMAKRRMKNRLKDPELYSEPRNPAVYNMVRKEWQDISQDPEYYNISHIKYDTETNQIEEVKVNPQIRPLVDTVKQILLNYI